MAAAEPEHNLRGHFSTTLPIIVDKPHRHAVQDGEASSAQAAQASNGEQRCTCRSIAARGFARADVGSCHEIRPCVDIGRQAARRNASAVARKTAPGIAAPAGVPRTVPPRQAHLPHRTPPASRVWRTCPWPGRSTPRRPAKTAQPPAVIPAAVAQGTPWKYALGSAYRTVRAGLLAGAGLGRPAPTGSVLLVGRLQKLLRISRTAGCDPSGTTTHRVPKPAPGSPLRSSGRYPHPRRSAPTRRRSRRTHRRNRPSPPRTGPRIFS